MGLPNSDNEVPPMSAATATEYVRRMVDKEASGRGDTEGALERLARRYGLGFWQLSHLRKGRAKSVDASLFARVRAAYLDMCERQLATLQHEIAMEKAVSGDDDFADLEAAASALAEKVAAQRATLSRGGKVK